MSSRNMCLLPRATLHRDREHVRCLLNSITSAPTLCFPTYMMSDQLYDVHLYVWCRSAVWCLLTCMMSLYCMMMSAYLYNSSHLSMIMVTALLLNKMYVYLYDVCLPLWRLLNFMAVAQIYDVCPPVWVISTYLLFLPTWMILSDLYDVFLTVWRLFYSMIPANL